MSDNKTFYVIVFLNNYLLNFKPNQFTGTHKTPFSFIKCKYCITGKVNADFGFYGALSILFFCFQVC